MGNTNHASQSEEAVFKEHVLALAWTIATEPKLYRELASNPYSSKSLQIISDRFSSVAVGDVITAIVLAEPEGRYDKIFNKLSRKQQEEEFYRQASLTSEITKWLNKYYSQRTQAFWELPQDLIYDILFLTAFETGDVQKVEEEYSQSQRKHIKLLILNFMNEAHLDGVSSHAFQVKIFKKIPRAAFAFTSLATIFSLIFIILSTQIVKIQAQSENAVLLSPISSQKIDHTTPARLKIPSINVDSAIENVGLTPKGAMDVPSKTSDVGWYSFGVRPGERGSAVIAGHLDGLNGEKAVFANLDKLKEGDKIYVQDGNGKIITFVVRKSRTYDLGHADDAFSPSENAHLNLITCDGVWDEVRKGYSKRLVVFADLVR